MREMKLPFIVVGEYDLSSEYFFKNKTSVQLLLMNQGLRNPTHDPITTQIQRRPQPQLSPPPSIPIILSPKTSLL